MRMFALTMCLVLTAPALGQQKAIPDVGPERDKWLDAILNNWETAMTKVTSLEAQCERVAEDKVFKNKEIYKGTAKYLKGDGPGQTSRASLYLVNTANPKVYEHLILSGTYLYEVAPATKEVRVHTLPQPKAGENVDHNLLGLLFGMKAADAKKRYKIDLVHADNDYFYLRVEAKLPNDKADFDVAQLALLRKTYLPRQLQFQQPNGNKVTWDLPTIQTPANLRPQEFEMPKMPADWKMNRVPTAGPGPSKVRSSGN